MRNSFNSHRHSGRPVYCLHFETKERQNTWCCFLETNKLLKKILQPSLRAKDSARFRTQTHTRAQEVNISCVCDDLWTYSALSKPRPLCTWPVTGMNDSQSCSDHSDVEMMHLQNELPLVTRCHLGWESYWHQGFRCWRISGFVSWETGNLRHISVSMWELDPCILGAWRHSVFSMWGASFYWSGFSLSDGFFPPLFLRQIKCVGWRQSRRWSIVRRETGWRSSRDEEANGAVLSAAAEPLSLTRFMRCWRRADFTFTSSPRQL